MILLVKGVVTAVIVATNLLSGLWTPVAAADPASGPLGYDQSHPSVESDGYEHAFDGKTVTRTPPKPGPRKAKDGVEHDYTYSRLCDVPSADAPAEEGCRQFWHPCPEGQVAMWVYRRRVTPPPGPIQDLGPQCLESGPRSVSVADLSRQLHEYVRARAKPQELLVQPTGWTLIRLPTIVSTVPAAPIEFRVAQPIPGVLRAMPSYAWDFGDGQQAVGPGRPFDGTDPRDEPDHYVAHAWQQKGAQQIRLTVTWHATFTSALGVIPLEDLNLSYGPATVEVRTARSRLVAGPGE